jgi:peroxiredoxin
MRSWFTCIAPSIDSWQITRDERSMKIQLLVAIVLLAWCAGVACGGAQTQAAPLTWQRPGLGGAVRPEMGSPQPGEQAPDFALPDLDGRMVPFASTRGSWVVLHFTATWCPFCDSEVDHLNALAAAFAARSVKTVIVDVEEEGATWRSYASQHVAPPMIALHDASGTVASRFAPPRAQPSFDDRAQAVLDATLIIDPHGTIRLFLLPDSAHFDPTFRAVRAELEGLVPQAVVAVRAAPQAIAAGTSADVAVILEVAPGYHVMADRPSAPNYVPTRVEFSAEPDVIVGNARYPAASSFRVGDRAIATFEGAVEVQLRLDVAKGAAVGARRLHGVVRYQACRASLCLFPSQRTFDVPLEIKEAKGVP